MRARSSGSRHAVLTIWDGQILKPPRVSRMLPKEPPGPQSPHRLPFSHFSPSLLLFCWPPSTGSFTCSASAQLTKASIIPLWCSSNPPAGNPHPDGFTPSPPSSFPCGSREKARKTWCMLKLSVQALPTFNFFSFCYRNTFHSNWGDNDSVPTFAYFCTVFPSYVCLFSILPGCFFPKTIPLPHTTSAGHRPPGEMRGASCWPHGEPLCLFLFSCSFPVPCANTFGGSRYSGKIPLFL